MRVAQRVEFSLSKTRVEKLIVCLGYNDDDHAGTTRGALAGHVARRLLQRCQPGSNDIHNPDHTRLHARDKEGRPRTYYAARDRQTRRSHHGTRAEAVRSPQTWDSSRVVDYMGVWCDRLLLGDSRQPSRCAVLEPRVPALLWGDSLARVAQSHRHLTRQDVLVVTAELRLPFGEVRLNTDATRCLASDGASTSPSPHFASTTSVTEALQMFARSPQTPFCLQIGIGDAHGPQSLLTAAEARVAERLLLPLSAFTAALWTANAAKAAEYVATVTATPDSLTEEKANARLWGTMQHAMLSTRDTALLRAHFNDEGLDARLSPSQTQYLAETLLQRLRDEELRR